MRLLDKLFAAAAALAIVSAAAPASAAIHTFTFEAPPGVWEQNFGSGGPFGLSDQPDIIGSVTVNSDLGGIDAFLALDFTTGTRTWTLADLRSGTKVIGSAGNVYYLNVAMGGSDPTLQNGFEIGPQDNSSYVLIGDGTNGIDCINCITWTDTVGGGGAVPEPATWALMIAGFGMAGAGLRRRAYAAS